MSTPVQYQVVYIQPGCLSCTGDIPKVKINDACNKWAAQGYELKEAYMDTTICNPSRCCTPSKSCVLIFGLAK